MVLHGLAAQRGVDLSDIEVIVMLDGSTDDSAVMLDAWVGSGRLPGLRWHLRANAGQAAARDYGARDAAADVLLFLDDDVVPEPDLVARHLAYHASGTRIALLGDCEIVRDPGNSWYLQNVWGWWEGRYASRVLRGRRPCYLDFCAGNVSLRQADYLASGGFDPAFRGYGGEDYDLGYRLMRQGVQLVADRRVRAMHHHTFPGYHGLQRIRRQEGHADVVLGRKHLELRAGLRLMKGDPESDRMIEIAFTRAGLSVAEIRTRTLWALLYARLGARMRWSTQLNMLLTYAYWRGLYEALGSWQALEEFREGAIVPVHIVDISDGMDEPPSDYWVNGPSELRVVAGGDDLGTVRIPGPVLSPLRATLADRVADSLSGPLWMWAGRTGTSLLPPSSSTGATAAAATSSATLTTGR